MDLKNFLQSPFSKQEFLRFLSERFYGFSQHISEDSYLGSVRLDDRKEIGFFIFEVENKEIENSRVGFHKELKKLADEYSLDGTMGTFYNVYLEPDVESFVMEIAKKRKCDASSVVNQLLAKDRELAEFVVT